MTGDSRFVLFDVDGTLVDTLGNLRRVWGQWAIHFDLDPQRVFEVAFHNWPLHVFAELVPDEDPVACLALLNDLEDHDVTVGDYSAFDGAAQLLGAMPEARWGLVTSNYLHRVHLRFARLGLPVPAVIVDAPSVTVGKPSPDPYLLAAELLQVPPAACLAVEDSPAGVASASGAGMTVWSVNRPDTVDGSHRHFATLGQAAADILDWVNGV